MAKYILIILIAFVIGAFAGTQLMAYRVFTDKLFREYIMNVITFRSQTFNNKKK